MSVKILTDLIKLRITIASTMTAALGYTMARGRIDFNIIPILVGGLLLASASAALNQIQEVDIDLKVNRTANRPIPSGRITKSTAIFVSITLFVIGLLILVLFYDWRVAALGVSAAILYNGIYTPLKRITPFAVVPGALIGAIPPLVGWVAAEGHLIDPRIYYLCFFFFIWQIPHFWLLLLFYSDQYKDNELPSLFDRFSENKVKQITFIGIVATAITGILLPSYILLQPQAIGFIISMSGIILMIRAFSLLKKKKANLKIIDVKKSYRKRFIEINIYALFVTLLVIVTNIV